MLLSQLMNRNIKLLLKRFIEEYMIYERHKITKKVLHNKFNALVDLLVILLVLVAVYCFINLLFLCQ
jgi:hypothetical protein